MRNKPIVLALFPTSLYDMSHKLLRLSGKPAIIWIIITLLGKADCTQPLVLIWFINAASVKRFMQFVTIRVLALIASLTAFQSVCFAVLGSGISNIIDIEPESKAAIIPYCYRFILLTFCESELRYISDRALHIPGGTSELLEYLEICMSVL